MLSDGDVFDRGTVLGHSPMRGAGYLIVLHDRDGYEAVYSRGVLKVISSLEQLAEASEQSMEW